MNGRSWSPSDVALVRELYPHKPSAAIAKQIGRPLTSVYQLAHKLGLHKSEVYLASADACRLRRGDNVGAAFRYPPGHVPANKGLRRPGYSPGRMAETQFKKGEPTNWWPVGSTRLVDGYVYRKVSDIRNVAWTRNWLPENRLVWEAANGPIPEGYALQFLNRDRTDTRLENLALISRADLCRLNSIHNLPPEIKGAITALGALKRRIRRSEKQDRRSA